MKITYRIPTEMYAYVEIEAEYKDDVPNPENVRFDYEKFSDAFKAKTGLPDKEFNQFIDRQLMGEDGNHIEQYNAMSPQQQTTVQIIKRALKRIKSKNE